MRMLPELEYLNGLPVERDVLDEDELNQDGTPNRQNDAALAVQQETRNNVGEQVLEMPEDEEMSRGYDSVNVTKDQHDTNASMASVYSVAKNANLLADHMDTEDLEAIAQCFDNIREIRKGAKLPNNNDNALGEMFDEKLTQMI